MSGLPHDTEEPRVIVEHRVDGSWEFVAMAEDLRDAMRSMGQHVRKAPREQYRVIIVLAHNGAAL